MALYKPPLLFWLTAISTRAFGLNTFSLRFPVVLAAALSVCLVFLWVSDARTRLAAVGAVLLLTSDKLWRALDTMCLTDGLLTALVVAAICAVARDPALRRRRYFWGFAAATAAAIMVKSVAGLLPLLILALYAVCARGLPRPSWRRLGLLAAAVALLAAPWFLYQLATHPRWFLAEHFVQEIFAFGLGNPPQTSAEGQFLFYARRLLETDPVLAIAAAVGIVGLVRAWRSRTPRGVLLVCWLAAVFATLLIWRYRNAAYLLPALPALAIAAAAHGPVFRGKRAGAALCVCAAAFLVKVSFPRQPWGLRFDSATRLTVAAPLSRYCNAARARDLVIVDMTDGLYATALPLWHVRYYMLGPPPASPSGALDFRRLGIVLTATEYLDIDRSRDQYAARLRQAKMRSTEAVGTLVTGDEAGLLRIVQAHPEADFFLPEHLRALFPPDLETHHEVVRAGGGYFFLLSRDEWPFREGTVKGCRL